MSKKVCTPFCDARKPCSEHHELLIALLNCSDQRSIDTTSNMEVFAKTVKKYLESGWQPEDDVPDATEGYRFPLIHWACVLGKCQAIQWLLENGFKATVRSKLFQETALHRSVLCLHYIVARRYEAKVEKVIDIMKDCLLIGDAEQDTPLHLCAKQLLKGGKRKFFSHTLDKMISKSQEMHGLTTKILNAVNRDGSTILHILSCNDAAIIQLRAAVEAGADPDIKNNDGLTALEVAIDFGNFKSINYLRKAVINRNDRERKKKENPKYLDKNVFDCGSPVDSSNSTEHGATESEDETYMLTASGRGRPTVSSSSFSNTTHEDVDIHGTEATGTDCNLHATVVHGGSSSSSDNGVNTDINNSADDHEKSTQNLHLQNPSAIENGPTEAEVGSESATTQPLKPRRGRSSKSQHSNSSPTKSNDSINSANTNIAITKSHQNSAQTLDSHLQFPSTSDIGASTVAEVVSESTPTQPLKSRRGRSSKAKKLDSNQTKEAGDINSVHGTSCSDQHSFIVACTDNAQQNDNVSDESNVSSTRESNVNISLNSSQGNTPADIHSRGCTDHDHAYAFPMEENKSHIGTGTEDDCPGNDSSNNDATHPRNGNSDAEESNPCSSSSNLECQKYEDEVTLLKIKTEPSGDYGTYQQCRSGTLCNTVNISTSSSLTEGGTQDFISLLQGAGLLKNVKEMAASLREKDEHRLSDLEINKQRVDQELETIEQGVNFKNEEISQHIQKLEQLKVELNKLKEKKATVILKRKRIDDEEADITKKLRCCNDLLNVVPKRDTSP